MPTPTLRLVDDAAKASIASLEKQVTAAEGQLTKLAGTRRWLELEEDIVSWRHSGRAPEDVLCRLTEFVQKRHYLFNRLSYLAGTRATWNT